MENRRNYYRVLHVQPDAPVAVIKATYRTLMRNLKMHPDLGGDTWNAALVNEAYAVLSDRLKRERYDRQILQNLRRHSVQTDDVGQTTRGSDPSYCLFCKSPFLNAPGQATRERCPECRSPLQGIDSEESKLTLRRIAGRIEQSFEIVYYTYWPQSPRTATAKDLSPTGIAIAGMESCFVGQLIKLESEFLNAIAQVKNREAVGDSSTQVRVGLKFLAVSFNLPRGTFVGITV